MTVNSVYSQDFILSSNLYLKFRPVVTYKGNFKNKNPTLHRVLTEISSANSLKLPNQPA